ncbi:MAG TPA: Rv2578c family radical SAM protein [Actinomycetes bacterium]
MRWDSLRLDDDVSVAAAATTPLLPRGAVTRTFDTPEFRGMTFHEVTCRSALNQVPEASRMPFRWTINPYRGCSHGCVYCFARKTHEYLDLDSGHDFDSQVVVKTNVGEVLRRELGKPSWTREHVAMGTNVDCYQRVEGRYRLMRDVIPALTEAANPFSILTKGALILRDLDLLVAAAEVTDVSAAFSVGFLDREVWRRVEPGTPPPQRRLEAVRALTDAGIPTGVLMAPVLPYLTDSEEQLDATVAAVAASGATHVSPIVLHLRPGAREWWQAWLARERPDLLPRYARLYGSRSYAPKAYQDQVTATVRRLATAHGVGRERAGRWRAGDDRSRRTSPKRTAPPPPAQLTLL